MDGKTTIFLQNEVSEISRLFEATASFVESHDLPPAINFPIDVCLEEIVTNVIKYGHKEKGAHEIEVRIEVLDGLLRIEVIDDGCCFDPTCREEVDTSIPLEDRPIGGLGIHMVKKMMDRLQYLRVEGKNHLVMEKQIAA